MAQKLDNAMLIIGFYHTKDIVNSASIISLNGAAKPIQVVKRGHGMLGSRVTSSPGGGIEHVIGSRFDVPKTILLLVS